MLDEFFRQGDAERQHGLPISPLCDRDTTSRPVSQINFLEFVIAPLYYHVCHTYLFVHDDAVQVVRIFPELIKLMEHLKENRRFWQKVYIEELEMDHQVNSEEEKGKAKKKLEAFFMKYKDVFEPK